MIRTITSLLVAACLSLGGLVAPAAAAASDAESAPMADIQRRLAAMMRDGEATAALARYSENGRTWTGAAGVSDLRTNRPADPDGYLRAGSITKTFVATVLLQLRDEGRLRLDDPVERHLPGVVPNGRAITVRHVLQHTSGLYDYASEPGYSTNRWRGDARFDGYEPEELLEVAFAHDPFFPPGTKWRYSNTNYVVAGMLIEKLTGHRYADEIRDRILRPLRLRQTYLPGRRSGLRAPHARGYAEVPVDSRRLVDATRMNPTLDWAAGELISTTDDLDRFFAALLDGRLLSARSRAEMRRTTRAEPGLFRYGIGLQEFPIDCGSTSVSTLGHTGELIGYLTVSLRDDAGRSLQLSFNPGLTHPSLESSMGILRSAFCAVDES